MVQTAQLTHQQIITHALEIVKAPKFLTQANDLYNAILQDLAENNDIEVIRQSVLLNIGPGTGNGQNTSFYILPADYYRAREVFYNVQGEIFYLYGVTLEEFDSYFQGPGISNFPYNYTVDMNPNPPQMAFYPPPATPLVVQIRYFNQPPLVVNPATNQSIPWFPNSLYLIVKLSAELMRITDDERQAKFLADADDILRKFLEMQEGSEDTVHKVELDRRLFRNFANLKPTKQTGPF